MKRVLLPASLVLLGAAAWAQSQARLISPEVHADKRVTFRFRAPNAKDVAVSLEGRPLLGEAGSSVIEAGFSFLSGFVRSVLRRRHMGGL